MGERVGESVGEKSLRFGEGHVDVAGRDEGGGKVAGVLWRSHLLVV